MADMQFLKRPKLITFTGGMGAQLISAAIYYALIESGEKVFADLSYFDKPEHIAKPGDAVGLSHWSWQLDKFGIHKSDFAVRHAYPKLAFSIIKDGPEKIELAMRAMTHSKIREKFSIEEYANDPTIQGSYACIHIRRGDYVNVANHLVSDNEFCEIAIKLSRLVDHLVVLSDSPISDELKAKLSFGFKQSSFLDNTDPFTAHCIMRRANVLVCSNSQFSMLAGLLNDNGFVILPTKWYADSHKEYEAPIHKRCSFEILK